MVVDLGSANYGWLQLPDRNEEAQVLLKVGKNWEGCFTLEDILKQADKAIDILQKHYPDDSHVLVYDNTTTHLEWVGGTLSAHQIPKSTSKPEAWTQMESQSMLLMARS